MGEAPRDAAAGYVPAVRTLYSAFARGDVAALLTMIHPDVEWGEPDNPDNPAGGTRRGHAGFLEWLRIGRQSEEILALEPRRFLADDDGVAVAGSSKCRVRATGSVYETDFVHLITFRDGKVVRFQEFFDTYAAAEAFRPGGDSTHQLVVEVYVRDLERSLGFYRAMGFELVRRTGGFAVVSWDGHLLFLDEQPQLAKPTDRETANVRVMVPDVELLWQRAQSLGAPIGAPLADRSYGLRDFTVRDPDGFGLRFASRLGA